MKLALRMLRRNPGLTAVAVFALAFGIPSALYPFHMLTVLEGRMPFDEGDEIVGVRHSYIDEMDELESTIHDLEAWRDALPSLGEIGAARRTRMNLATGARLGPWRGAYMTASAFGIVRVHPLVGRPLQPADEVAGAPDVVVLGFDPWRVFFDSDPDVVGRTIRLAGVPHTVVGVMPRDFRFPARAHFWVPLRDRATAWPVGEGPEILVFGRLADGASRRRLLAEMTTVRVRLADDHPDVYGRVRAEVVPYPYLAGGNPTQAKWILLPFQILAMVLLAVACGNVGTLVMARIATRTDEVAVRTALGASRARIVSQIFVETLVMAVLAAGIGLAIAQWASQRLGQVEGIADRPFFMELGLRPSTVLLGLGLAVFSAVFAGVVPALKATGARIQGNLQRRAGGGAVRFGHATTALIVAEVALAVICVFAIGVSRQYLPPPAGSGVGVPLDRFLSARLVVDETSGYRRPVPVSREDFRARVAAVEREVVRRLEREPGVRGVAVASVLPGQDHWTRRVEVEGIPPSASDDAQRVMVAAVGLGYFEAIGHPVLEGRGFSEADLPEDPGQVADVVVVNTAFAGRLMQGRDPVGQRIRVLAWREGSLEWGPWLRVVGVVGSAGMVTEGANRPDDAGFYQPLRPGELHPIGLGVHVAGRPEAFAPVLRAVVADVDPTVLVDDPLPLNEVVNLDRELMQWALLGVGVVAGIALVLSVAGLYALMSFTVSQRTREIGVRTALGADVADIMTVVVRRALLQLSLGVGLAVVGSLVALLKVFPTDSEEWLWQLVGASALVLAIGLAACVVPTLRGLRIRPVEALRS
jgi:predicted permease